MPASQVYPCKIFLLIAFKGQVSHHFAILQHPRKSVLRPEILQNQHSTTRWRFWNAIRPSSPHFLAILFNTSFCASTWGPKKKPHKPTTILAETMQILIRAISHPFLHSLFHLKIITSFFTKKWLLHKSSKFGF